MLDQNTDRMWFVIGAVIIGAAIIFIANGALPDIFASTSETMRNTAGQFTMAVEDEMDIDYIYENTRHVHQGTASYAGTIGGVEGSVIERNFEVEPGKTYVLRYTMKEDARIMHVFGHKIPAERNVHNQIYTDIYADMPEGEKAIPHHHRGKVTQAGKDVRIEFAPSPGETYLTLTTSNVGLGIENHGSFRVVYENIRLFEKGGS